MHEGTPMRIGVLFDYVGEKGGMDGNVLKTLELAADEFFEQGLIDRRVEFVVRAVPGLPQGSYKVVKDAFIELVDEGVLAIMGPLVSENAAELGPLIERTAEVPCITMSATEEFLSDWGFGLPCGSLSEEPLIIAHIMKYDGCRTVAIAYEDSLIGEEYLRSARHACAEAGLEITGEAPVGQLDDDKTTAMSTLAEGKADALLQFGFGLALGGTKSALDKIGWAPRCYTITSMQFALSSEWWSQQLAGWTGLDLYDERNTTGQALLDRFKDRYGYRPNYYFPLYTYDVIRLILTAAGTARPLTGRGVRNALEQIKNMPAACGAPGTRLRFGKHSHHGWVGSEYLVSRRVLPDGSGSVLAGTIEGLVEPPEGAPPSRRK